MNTQSTPFFWYSQLIHVQKQIFVQLNSLAIMRFWLEKKLSIKYYGYKIYRKKKFIRSKTESRTFIDSKYCGQWKLVTLLFHVCFHVIAYKNVFNSISNCILPVCIQYSCISKVSKLLKIVFEMPFMHICDILCYIQIKSCYYNPTHWIILQCNVFKTYLNPHNTTANLKSI